MAARAIWKGSLSFGLVNVPVGLYTATTDRTVHFHQVQKGTADRIRYKKVNERTGEEVPGPEIQKVVDVGTGEYVALSQEELDTAAPEKSRNIEIEGFVDLADIDPIYYRSTYYLAPESEDAARAYFLLRQAMRRSGKVGVATFVMRNKEYLVAIRPEAEVLALETMYFADEIRSPSKELPNLEEGSSYTDKELDMAEMLISSLALEWDPEQYHDSYREHVASLVAEKRQGHDVIAAREARPAPSNVVDLLATLQASVARGAGAREADDAAPRAATRKPAAKRPPAKTAPRTAAARKPAAKKQPARKAASRGATRKAPTRSPAKRTVAKRKAS